MKEGLSTTVSYLYEETERSRRKVCPRGWSRVSDGNIWRSGMQNSKMAPQISAPSYYTSKVPSLRSQIQPLYPDTELNLGDRVLGEVEKDSFIALPGKGGHSGLMPSKLCVPAWRG